MKQVKKNNKGHNIECHVQCSLVLYFSVCVCLCVTVIVFIYISSICNSFLFSPDIQQEAIHGKGERVREMFHQERKKSNKHYNCLD